MATLTEPREVALQALLDAMPEGEVHGPLPRTVRGLTDDSRRVTAGSCFVAVRGLRADGHRFIPQAVERGARDGRGGAPGSLAGGGGGADPGAGHAPRPAAAGRRLLWPSLARPHGRGDHGHERQDHDLVSLRGPPPRSGLRHGRHRDDPVRRPRPGAGAGQTTPEAIELQGLLAEMVAAGVGGVAMEVSSHALALHRVDGVAFDVAVFTNLTQDHLDFHGTMEAYAKAKGRLFFELLAAGRKPGATAVLNADDPVGDGLGGGAPRPGPHVRAGRRPRGAPAPVRVGAGGHPASGRQPRGAGPDRLAAHRRAQRDEPARRGGDRRGPGSRPGARSRPRSAR